MIARAAIMAGTEMGKGAFSIHCNKRGHFSCARTSWPLLNFGKARFSGRIFDGTNVGFRTLGRRFGKRLLRTSEDYQAEAVRCLRLAQTIDYAPSKAMLLDMAQEWVKLAQQARERENEKAGA